MHHFTKKLADGIHKKVDQFDFNKSRPSLSRMFSPRSDEGSSSITDVNEEMLYRYRKQRGVNLGSWFVLERWISEEPFRFAAAPGQSDLDVARGQNAKEVLEHHWDTWITENDWVWITERGINTVRIPIGYYHLCGIDRSVLDRTEFKDFYHVFSGAWTRIVMAIEAARRYGIGVLLDLHAAPGKQNDDAHGGTSNPPTFFSNSRNKEHTVNVLHILLRTLNHVCQTHDPRLTNVVGIELLNEPHPPSDTALKDWYTSAINKLANDDPTMPLYLGECWRTDSYAKYLKSLSATTSTLIVLDHHLYRCFTGSDITTTAMQHAGALMDPNAQTPQMLARISEQLSTAGCGIVIGEWSGALNPGSLTGQTDEQRSFVHAQLDLFERYCAGWFFWTYRKGQGRDEGWSLRDAVSGGVFPAWIGMRANRRPSNVAETFGRRDGLKDQATNAHSSYWQQYPGDYAPWRFAEGFALGWDDAYTFFTSSTWRPGTVVSELGFKGAWAKRRTQDHGKSFWEFAHGFNQGADAARNDFLQFYSQ